ncbi:hypothetical protein VNO77_32912 [Canavalia gladiata]|uniref:Uncharacterized protein n=1 Tax=Canavalia gladiata TaxID=3824 RepID=A0AAN9PVY0_CANGL
MILLIYSTTIFREKLEFLIFLDRPRRQLGVSLLSEVTSKFPPVTRDVQNMYACIQCKSDGRMFRVKNDINLRNMDKHDERDSHVG